MLLLAELTNIIFIPSDGDLKEMNKARALRSLQPQSSSQRQCQMSLALPPRQVIGASDDQTFREDLPGENRLPFRRATVLGTRFHRVRLGSSSDLSRLVAVLACDEPISTPDTSHALLGSRSMLWGPYIIAVDVVPRTL